MSMAHHGKLAAVPPPSAPQTQDARYASVLPPSLQPCVLLSRSTSDTGDGRGSFSISVERLEREGSGLQSDLSFTSRRSGSDRTLSDDGPDTALKHRLKDIPTEDMSCSDDVSVSSEKSAATHRSTTERPQRTSSAPLHYHGVTMSVAASQGNLPLCVLLWGMATAKKVRIMDPDSAGDTPMHFAALADLPEVLNFFRQQDRAKTSPFHRLLEQRNMKGETPLLRACCLGKIPTLRFLFDADSDPFVTDNKGCTVFINLASHCHLWGLHFVYSYLCNRFGYVRTYSLLCAEDMEGYNAMYWAARTGDVNVVEYLIRRNLDPSIPDSLGRTPLHIAAKKGKLDCVVFLMKCGCDAHLRDREGHTPYSLAAGNAEVLSAISLHSRSKRSCRLSCIGSCVGCGGCCVGLSGVIRGARPSSPSMLVGIEGGDIGGGSIHGGLKDPSPFELESGIRSKIPSSSSSANSGKGRDMGETIAAPPRSGMSGVSLFKDIRGVRRPHAMRRLKPSHLPYACIYSAVVVGYWVLAAAIPFYAWIFLVFGTVALFRNAQQRARHNKAESEEHSAKNNPRNVPRSRIGRYYTECLMAPEKYLGMYLGMMTITLLFWLDMLRIGTLYGIVSGITGPGSYLYRVQGSDVSNEDTGNGFLFLGGLSDATDDFPLFITVMVVFLIAAVLWVRLVWMESDPGAVGTRNEDFEKIMDVSLSVSGAPLERFYCNTTMVRKPSRSKYCAQTGLVIARMDHHCVWLNNSVGYGNHRMFIVFLIVQLCATSLFAVMIVRALGREIGLRYSAAAVIGVLLDRRYFFTTTLCTALCMASIALLALLIEQSINISINITMNERLNRSRYPWMNDTQGLPFNHYDRGFLRNVLEFWRIPGFTVNYLEEFHDTAQRSHSSEKGPLLGALGPDVSNKSDSKDPPSFKGAARESAHRHPAHPPRARSKSPFDRNDPIQINRKQSAPALSVTYSSSFNSPPVPRGSPPPSIYQYNSLSNLTPNSHSSHPFPSIRTSPQRLFAPVPLHMTHPGPHSVPGSTRGVGVGVDAGVGGAGCVGQSTQSTLFSDRPSPLPSPEIHRVIPARGAESNDHTDYVPFRRRVSLPGPP